MLLTLTIILLAVSLACFIVAAATTHVRDPQTTPWARTNWLAVGLAVWILLQLIVAVVR